MKKKQCFRQPLTKMNPKGANKLMALQPTFTQTFQQLNQGYCVTSVHWAPSCTTTIKLCSKECPCGRDCDSAPFLLPVGMPSFRQDNVDFA